MKSFEKLLFEMYLSRNERRRSSISAKPELSLLPDEVIQAIISYLDELSVLRLSQVSKKFNKDVDEPLLWKHFYQRDFKFQTNSRDIALKLKDITFRDWRQLYHTRSKAARHVRSEIRNIIREPTGRLARTQSILDHGYSVKDDLIQLYQDAKNTDHYLAQRYWVHSALGCLNRALALEAWNKLRFRSDVDSPTECGLAGLDMFILEASSDGDIDDSFQRLEEIVASVERTYPDLREQTPRTRAITIADHIREKGFVGLDEGRRYHSLDNMFLGISLRSPHRNSLPLVSAVIYCYVCRRFNLSAQPINFPMHVHALVQPQGHPAADFSQTTSSIDSAGIGTTVPLLDLDSQPLPPNHNPATLTDRTHLYMDPFHTSTPTQPSQLLAQLRFIAPNAIPEQISSYLSPATPRSLLIRSAHNILNAVNMGISSPTTISPENFPIDVNAATYAALYALVLFPRDPAQLRQNIAELTQHFLHYFPGDARNFRDVVLPLVSAFPEGQEYRALLDGVESSDNDVLEDDGPAGSDEEESDDAWDGHDVAEADEDRSSQMGKVKRRGGKNRVVKFRVGQVFRHRRRGYTAVIYGWDKRCEMSEGWIVGNRVDDLSRGRYQPFYNVLVDDTTKRYVAQENVELLTPGEFNHEDVERFAVEIGRWFKRFDEEKCLFVSNLQHEYPEDQ